MENQMKKTALFAVLAALLLGGCASSGNSYNTYDNRSQNEKQIDKTTNEEMNSLSKKDIEQLNKLK
jgi:uncharacterized lipoprotein YmbA